MCHPLATFIFFPGGTFCSPHRPKSQFARGQQTFCFWYLVSAICLADTENILKLHFPVVVLLTDQELTLESWEKPVPQEQLAELQPVLPSLVTSMLPRKERAGNRPSQPQTWAEFDLPFNT